MSNMIKGYIDHTHQSIFHHGLIKLIICTVLQMNNRIWDHFLFWSGFSNEQEYQVKKTLMNKKFGFVKRFRKDLVDDLVQVSVQENSPSQGFKLWKNMKEKHLTITKRKFWRMIKSTRDLSQIMRKSWV